MNDIQYANKNNYETIKMGLKWRKAIERRVNLNYTEAQISDWFNRQVGGGFVSSGMTNFSYVVHHSKLIVSYDRAAA